jgi:hypothetical protein
MRRIEEGGSTISTPATQLATCDAELAKALGVCRCDDPSLRVDCLEECGKGDVHSRISVGEANDYHDRKRLARGLACWLVLLFHTHLDPSNQRYRTPGVVSIQRTSKLPFLGDELLTTQIAHQATLTRTTSLLCHSSLQVALPAVKMAAGGFGDERTEVGVSRQSAFSPGASHSNTSKRLLEQTVSPTQGALSAASLDSNARAIVLSALHIRRPSHLQPHQPPRSPQLDFADPPPRTSRHFRCPTFACSTHSHSASWYLSTSEPVIQDHQPSQQVEDSA